MFYYSFILTPSRSKSDIIFTNFTNLFFEAVAHINAGLAFKRDGKELEIDAGSIQEKALRISLRSPIQLTNPARSLSSLTRYLTSNYPDEFKPYIYNKTLFNIKPDTQSSITGKNSNEMTNEELLKSIIDLLYTQANSKAKTQAVNELKEIVKHFK